MGGRPWRRCEVGSGSVAGQAGRRLSCSRSSRSAPRRRPLCKSRRPRFEESDAQGLRDLALFDPADAIAIELEPYVDPGTSANGLKPGDQCANLLELLAIDRFIEKDPTLVKGRVDVMNTPYRAEAVLMVSVSRSFWRVRDPRRAAPAERWAPKRRRRDPRLPYRRYRPKPAPGKAALGATRRAACGRDERCDCYWRASINIDAYPG